MSFKYSFVNMTEDVELNVLVSNIVSENKYSHCRLCLKSLILDTFFKFHDSVCVEPNFTKYQVLSDVLSKLFGNEICDVIHGIDAVCSECADKAVECMNFFKKCEESTTILNKVFDNLTNTLDVKVETVNKEHSLYIVFDNHKSELMWATNETDNHKLVAAHTDLKCMECSKHFNNIDHLKEHVYESHGLLTCEKCLDICEEDKLNDHEMSNNQYQCSECNETRCTKESLSKHRDKFHSAYVCQECGKSFKGLEKLHIHEQKHTTKQKCPKCGKMYTTKEFYLKHVSLCLEDKLDPHPMRNNIAKKYCCDECGKGYGTLGGLKVHYRFIHGNAKYHECDYCNKKFTAKSYLKTHMIKHTGEKNFKCDICGNRFVSKEALLYHIRRHKGEKPYSCKLCDERFVNASARAEHIKFKHIGPTLMCEICSRKFVTPNFLRLHIKKHHDPANNLYVGRTLAPPNVPGEPNMRVRL